MPLAEGGTAFRPKITDHSSSLGAAAKHVTGHAFPQDATGVQLTGHVPPG